MLTADVITPPVDDPYVFGQIAAANALSDVYAMGGRPIACLNLVGFPADKLEQGVLERILAGALDKITEAGAVLAGGHTTVDAEPRFGLSVTGVVHPRRFWSNAGARPGDALVLTKPIGSGVLFNARRKGRVSAKAMALCIDHAVALNRTAAEVLERFEVHAATDVTGFGLAGHALEVARASGVALRLDVDRVPLLPEALESYERGTTTGVNAFNRRQVEADSHFDPRLERSRSEVFFDPQTSGGLFVALAAEQADEAVAALHEAGVGAACRVGRCEELVPPHHLIFESTSGGA